LNNELIDIQNNSKQSFALSEKQKIYTNYFWIGFVIYTTGYVLRSNEGVSPMIGQLIQVAGLGIFFFFSTFLIRFQIKNHYLKLLFIIYCIWALVTIVRGIHFNATDLGYFFLSADYGGILYFSPLILLFIKDLNYKKLFEVILILGIIFLLFDVLFIRKLLDRSFETQNVIEYLVRSLAMPCGFLLLTYKYHSNPKKLLAIAVLGISILFSVYKARRGLTITLVSIVFGIYCIYLSYSKEKVIVVYLAVLFITLAAFYSANIYDISENKLLSMIAERGDENTRKGVELYFYNDMGANDWVIGRGLNGEYYCPDVTEDQPSNYRDLIETGYLQIILKGGLIRLVLFLFISIPAIFLGLFSSKNLLSKASAIWIIIALISLYPSTVESFSLQYLLVWISIGICYSKEMRNLSNPEVKALINAEV
jgi:hypothetical protein